MPGLQMTGLFPAGIQDQRLLHCSSDFLPVLLSSPRSGEKVVEKFLKKNRDFEKIERTLLLPNVNGTDGFFICVMKRNDLME